MVIVYSFRYSVYKKITPIGDEWDCYDGLYYYKRDICMTTLYVTESGSFIKRKGGHVIVGRNHEVLLKCHLGLLMM